MDAIRLLTELLQRFSPTGYETDAVSFMIESMRQFGFQAHRDEAGNAVGTIGSGSREILLLGHIDTVPGKIAVRMENEILYGRGAVDAKGPLASFIFAGAQASLTSDWRITVIGAVGEEGDSLGARHLCKTYPAPEMVVIGEPSGWESITLGYKGSFWSEASIVQPSSHTASGITSACDQIFRFWNQLTNDIEELNAGKTRVFDRLSPSIRGMRSTSDGFEDNAILDINIRLPREVDLPLLEGLLSKAAEKAGNQPVFKTVDYMPAYQGEKNTTLVKSFLHAIRANGGAPGFKLKTGTSDMNLVGPVWNCPMIAYGAGDSNLDHTANEHIVLSEFLKGIQVLTTALERIQCL
ncbi:MAG: [LysW]-lysine hydrolase [Leptolinea sp.]|nr:[LysW]-lysine hydrolase [Leptolinea sp.]